ncbi:MAG: stress responsive alpha-beta barrel domain protein [Planctomycetaceae bacterium]|nr:stress responsive alpha-beta barrel domain protein [Planctomycetaceae bacterium]|tara:strand:- start:493 stop:882 length:390 start_codon:yes stop_codon:yes gene_type:complete
MLSLKYMFLLLLTVTLITPVATAQTKAKKGVYRHVVLFGFNENVSKQQIKEIEDAFVNLPKQIDTIIDFEFGTNVSPENINDGLTHCFFVTFKDKAGLEVYLPHPAHKKFVELVQGKLAKVVVVDYVSK